MSIQNSIWNHFKRDPQAGRLLSHSIHFKRNYFQYSILRKTKLYHRRAISPFMKYKNCVPSMRPLMAPDHVQVILHSVFLLLKKCKWNEWLRVWMHQIFSCGKFHIVLFINSMLVVICLGTSKRWSINLIFAILRAATHGLNAMHWRYLSANYYAIYSESKIHC